MYRGPYVHIIDREMDKKSSKISKNYQKSAKSPESRKITFFLKIFKKSRRAIRTAKIQKTSKMPKNTFFSSKQSYKSVC